MKIKRKEKTVKVFTIKLTQKELEQLYSDIVDVGSLPNVNTVGTIPAFWDFYDTLRAEVHSL